MDEWKYDSIPEILDGHNVADFIDPEIAMKLDALEREEEENLETGHYATPEVDQSETAVKTRQLLQQIRNKKIILFKNRCEARGKNRATLTRSDKVPLFIC